MAKGATPPFLYPMGTQGQKVHRWLNLPGIVLVLMPSRKGTGRDTCLQRARTAPHHGEPRTLPAMNGWKLSQDAGRATESVINPSKSFSKVIRTGPG